MCPRPAIGHGLHTPKKEAQRHPEVPLDEGLLSRQMRSAATASLWQYVYVVTASGGVVPYTASSF